MCGVGGEHQGCGTHDGAGGERADGRLEDFLQLAVKTRPVVMTSRMRMKTRLEIGPGKESVPEKLRMSGGFTLAGIHFSNPRWQEQVNLVSLRAQGYAADARLGAAEVATEMKGDFAMSGGKLRFSDLDYTMPGATVALAGVYSLDGEQFDFSGKVRTQAKVSQMVSSWWKQIPAVSGEPGVSKEWGGDGDSRDDQRDEERAEVWGGSVSGQEE